MNLLFGARLKALRKRKKLSQSRLGKAVGVHYNHIGRYECGKAYPSTPVLVALSKVLGISVDSLVSETEPIPSAEPTPRTVGATRSDRTCRSDQSDQSGGSPQTDRSDPTGPSRHSSASPELLGRLSELTDVCRTLPTDDLRTVIAVLEAFVLRARVSDLHIGR